MYAHLLILTSLLAASAHAVTLVDQGRVVVLSNDLVVARVEKRTAHVESLRYAGHEMAKDIYFSMDGGENYMQPSHCIYSVKTNTADIVDIALRRVWRNEPQAFDIEMHYVLRRGDSGLYAYAILEHPKKYPATGYGEWRMVWKLSDDLLEWICVDERRQWQMPASDDKRELTGIKEITKLLTGVRAGQYDCKYDFNASYYDIGCWGHASNTNKIGAWIVLGGKDYFNDGPMKQDLNAAAGINHIHFGMNHYNGSTVHVATGEHWRKMYGPYLLYCNSDPAGVGALWKDAKARAKTEEAAWPYRWADLGERGAVAGKFIVDDKLKPQLTGAGAWIGVAQGDWQFDSKNYQYWARADAAGNFTIPAVRPGAYSLHAFVTGAVGEFAHTNVIVEAGQTTSLGDLTWRIPHKGHIAWEIGIPDRTAKEFRHGDDYFHGYGWERFPKELTNPLDYTVGKSNWSNDWNYAQSNYRDAPWKWRVHFSLPELPTGDATLTLAFASAHNAEIAVELNDTAVETFKPAVQGGNALLRESIHAKYCVKYVSIPVAKLRRGDNTLTLVQTNTIGPGDHVMYDYINLELP